MMTTKFENPKTIFTNFLSYGLGGKQRIKKTDAEINSYLSKLEGGEHISIKENPFIPDSLRSYIDKYSKNSVVKAKQIARAYDGFYAACHTFAVMSGKEKSYGPNWDIEQRLCSNMICQNMFGCSGIYQDDDVKNIIPDITEYMVDGNINKPILTPEILTEAFRRFPVKEIVVEKAMNELKKTQVLLNEDDDIIDIEFEEVEESPIYKGSVENPIFRFNNENLNLDPVKNRGKLPVKQEEKFNKIFGEYLKGKKYELFKMEHGTINCVINFDNGGYNSLIIDPGLCVGDNYYVLVKTSIEDAFIKLNVVPVHPSEKEILTKVFEATTETYMLTPEEHQKALSHILKNHGIYSVFDMSSLGSKRIISLKNSPENFRKFGQKLTFIINCINTTGLLGRLRFSKWNGIDSFEVRSDEDKKNKLRSPLPPNTLMNQTGVVIEVNGDDVSIESNGETWDYNITEYGVL